LHGRGRKDHPEEERSEKRKRGQLMGGCEEKGGSVTGRRTNTKYFDRVLIVNICLITTFDV